MYPPPFALTVLGCDSARLCFICVDKVCHSLKVVIGVSCNVMDGGSNRCGRWPNESAQLRTWSWRRGGILVEGATLSPCFGVGRSSPLEISFLDTFRAWKTSRHQSEPEFLNIWKKTCGSERERIRRHLLMKSKWSALIGGSIHQINAEYLLSVKPTGRLLSAFLQGFDFCPDLFPALLSWARRLRRGCLVFVSTGVKATCARCNKCLACRQVELPHWGQFFFF